MDHAVSLFNDVINATARTTTTAEKSLADWEVAGKLKVMQESQNSYPPEERLHAFQKEIAPYFDALHGPAPKHIFTSAITYLGHITSEVTRKGLLGFSIEISEVLSRIGSWDMGPRNALVLNLCHILISSKDPAADQSSAQALVELIDMWKHISQLGRASQFGQPLAFTLPNTEEIHKNVDDELNEHVREHLHKKGRKKLAPSQLRPAQALSSLFLTGSPATASRAVPGLLATTVVFWDRRIVGPRVPPEAQPLLKAIATVLTKVEVSTADVAKLFSPDFVRIPREKLTRLHFYVKGQWTQVVEALLVTEDKTWGDTILPTASRSGGSYLASFHKKFRQASKARNLTVVKELWEDFKKRIEGNEELHDQLREDAEFMDFCVYVWCSLRHNQYLQETVDLMNSMDMEPTVKSYTAMMHGWKTAKDIGKIDALWKMLMQSEVQLDSFIWAERVSAYIATGKPQRAVEALGDMMRLWKAAVAAGQEHKAVKPTIEVINAALKELLRLDKKAAHEVLRWASTEQIHPDIVTYNILLREAFRSGSRDSVPGILAAMREQSIDPDSASFTIILEEVLSTMSHSSANEQVRAVHRVLDDMIAAGIKPNQETYGKMLHAIASLRDGGSDEAIQAVLDHARKKAVPITPHMVTILIERILAQEHPSMTAIEALLTEHNLHRRTSGDQTLWERVMTGYAITNNIPSAMTIFNDLQNDGRPVTSLSCLKDLLQALLENGEKKDAKWVVECTLRNKLRSREDLTGNERYWKHRFWFLAQGRGLLEGLDLPPDLGLTLGMEREM